MSHLSEAEFFKPLVFQALNDTFERQRAVLEPLGPESVSLVDSAQDYISGGKLLRPLFCYWGWRGAGGTAATSGQDSVVLAGAALELFQAAALLHDDVLDDSDTRRGKPAMHRRHELLHSQEQLQGDARRFGEATAILLGDLCLSWSEEVFAAATEPSTSAREVFNQMRTELMAGQYLDLLHQAGGLQGPPGALPDSIAKARHVIRFKTVSYTVMHPLRMGGALAGASDDVLDFYAELADPIGQAFQMRDDLLGVFADPAETGKPAGDDLREGKRTVLIALGQQKSDTAEASTLTEMLGDHALGDAQMARAREILTHSGARKEVEAMIRRASDQALDLIARGPIQDEAREALTTLVHKAAGLAQSSQ